MIKISFLQKFEVFFTSIKVYKANTSECRIIDLSALAGNYLFGSEQIDSNRLSSMYGSFQWEFFPTHENTWHQSFLIYLRIIF